MGESFIIPSKLINPIKEYISENKSDFEYLSFFMII